MKKVLLAAVLTAGITTAVSAADWPMWRYNEGRTASSPHDLPDNINLLWVRQFTPRTPVWDDPLNQDIMPYDRIFEPVVSGKNLIIGFNDTDKVMAIDTGTGEERWTFYTDGPVRLPAVVQDGNVYFTSDDGFLYCVAISDGSLVWKFRGGPDDSRLLGNKRLISMWPARGGPVIDDGIVYFAASIWPFMGTFIYALDAGTGDVVWVNDGNGSEFMLQPHNAPSFAGVAPQGAFVVAGDKLLIPGGRSVPAVFDRATGKLLYYHLASSGKTGGSFVCADNDVFFNHYREKVTTMYHLGSGNTLVSSMGEYPVLAGDTWYFSGDAVSAYTAGWVENSLQGWIAEKGSIEVGELRGMTTERAKTMKRWALDVDASGDLIQAGGRLYAAGGGSLTAIELGGNEAGNNPSVAWIKTVDASIERLIAADDKLFAVTQDGRIMAFGEGRRQPARILDRPFAAEHSPEMTRKARDLLDLTGVRDGYALMYGVGDGDFLAALINNSDIHIVAVDRDETKVRALKKRFDENGLYGSRVSIHAGDLRTFRAPRYFSSLTIVNDRVGDDSIADLFRSLRPYGGVAVLSPDANDARKFSETIRRADLAGAASDIRDGHILLKRDGPLAGAGVWTHTYGDIANTAKSDDDLVRLPLGLLWFGGNSNLDVLPRHGHGPPEQVVGGRLFIEGMDCLSARDVYTGRVIWKTELLDLETYNVYYDKTYKDAPTDTRYNQVHLPGANIRGTNFVATLDRVYVLQGADCIVLDAATGDRIDTFRLPPVDPGAERKVYPEWGYIGVSGDYLIGGTGFVAFSDLVMNKKEEYSIWEDFDTSASKGIVVMNRMTGETLWKRDAAFGFLHNGTAAGNGRLYCLDKLPPHIEGQLARRGKAPAGEYRMYAFDIATGDIAWEEAGSIFGSFLGYSEEHDMLVQSTRPSRDMVQGETGKRMQVLRGSDGSLVWDRDVEYRTFPIIHGEKLITEGRVFNLFTGEPLTRNDPLTGRPVPWTWKRNYGCNYPIASEHLLTFRSGAAGFFNLENLGGTGNFGGFKSGCTISLIAADGVLNAPDYTRTCNCAYQNQTSLAMVHMPDADIEVWTFDTVAWDGSPVERVGINFGAPGDRLDDSGTLWLDYPSVGGESPDIPITVSPESPEVYRHHASWIKNGDHKWVTASGAVGMNELRVSLSESPMKERNYTVRLHFAEPERAGKGDRVFNVTVQGKQRLNNIDIIAETGASRSPLVREIRDVASTGELLIAFAPTGRSAKPPVVSGIEIIAQ